MLKPDGYKVVTGIRLDELVATVNHLMRQGWQVVGGFSALMVRASNGQMQPQFFQAMQRDTSDADITRDVLRDEQWAAYFNELYPKYHIPPRYRWAIEQCLARSPSEWPFVTIHEFLEHPEYLADVPGIGKATVAFWTNLVRHLSTEQPADAAQSTTT